MTATGRAPGELGSFPLYPTAFALAFVVAVWLQSSLDAVPLARPMSVALAFAAATTVAAVALVRHRHVGGAIAGLAVLGVIGGDDGRVSVLAALGIVGIVVLAVRQARFHRPLPWPAVTRLLNLLSIALIVVLAVQAIATIGGLRRPTAREATGGATVASADLPDIVVILLDAHGREDILEDAYAEDISGFTGGLRDRGFHVSPASRSNYMNTQLTLASMFNLRHLAEMDLPSQTSDAYNAALRASLDGNQAFAELRGAGYHVAVVSPGYEGVALRSADLFLEGGQASELEAVLVANSALRHGMALVSPTALADQARQRVLWNLEPSNWLPGVAPAAAIGRPYFLFVHVPSPHFPFLFGRDGEPLNDRPVVVTGRGTPAVRSDASIAAAASAYAAQLAFVDGLAIAAIDEVLAAVPPETVIILMADHGPDAHVDWDHLEATNARERFATLFAARTPGVDRLFGDAPTPVNLMPVLLNEYAGTTLAIKSDASFLGYPPRQELVDIGNPDEAAR